MTSEEKINIIKTKFKDAAKLDFDCSVKYQKCSDCPLCKKENDNDVYYCSGICDDQELLGEIWAESHGYIKKEEILPKVNARFIEDLAKILESCCWETVVTNSKCLKYTLVNEKGCRVQWEEWLKDNLFVKDTEMVETSNEEITEPVKTESDPINPSHYQQGDMQTIEKIMVLFGKEVVIGFCKGNAFKYTDRAGLKGSAEVDKAKANWYLRLAEKLEHAPLTDDGVEILKEFLKEETKGY